MQGAAGARVDVAAAEALRRRLDQQAAVAALGREALAGAPVDELLAQAARAAAAGLETDLVGVLLADEAAGTLVCRSSVGWSPEMIRPVPLGTASQLAHTHDTGEPTVVSDLDTDARFPSSRHLLEHGIVSGIGVPIAGADRRFGVLAAHARSLRSFREDDVLFLDGVANVLAAALVREEAERVRAAAATRLALLADAGDALATGSDLERALRRAAAVVVPRMAEWCLVHLVRGELLEAVAVAHADPERVESAPVLERPVALTDPSSSLAAAARACEPRIVEPGRDAAFAEAGLRSALIVPLAVQGACAGTLTLASSGPEAAFGEDDVAFALELGRRAAVAVEHARLVEHRERSLDHAQRLQRTSAFLAGAVRREDVLRIVLEAGLDACGAASALVALDVGGGEVEIAGDRGYAPEHLRAWRRFTVDDAVPVGRAMLARRGVYCASKAERDAEFPSMTGLGPGGNRALAALPLPVGGEVAGALVLGFADDHYFEADERLFLETLAAQAGQALERARLFDLHEGQAASAQRLAATLAVERERLEEVLNQMPVAALIRDATPERRVLLANERARELLGRDLPETLHARRRRRGGRHRFDGVPLARAIRDGEVVRDEELVVRRADGTTLTVLGSAAPIRDADGTIVAGIATFHDVTAEREARARADELHLQVSLERERLRAVLEQMPSGVVLADRDGRLLLGNPQVEAIWRQPFLSAVALGTDVSRGFHPDGRPYEQHEWPLARALATGERVEHEHIAIERGDGTRGVLSVGAAPIRGVSGEIVAGVAVYSDVTEEIEARAEAERRADAAAALAFVADGICLVDVDGTVRLWNDAASRITGVRAADVLGRRLLDAVGQWADLQPRIPVAWAGERQRPRPATLPVEFEGRECWLSISGVRFHGGAVYAFRDVTEEHGLDTMKSDFIATVSHELRTPLSAVYGAASTLRHRTSLGPEEREQFLAMIEEQSERLSRIVNEILIASRLESGEIAVALTRVDGVALVRELVAVAERGSPEGFAVELQAADDVPRVLADADRLRQVVGNLLENAVKYSGDARLVEVRVERARDRVAFVVSDHGIGIPAAEQERIFEKFYRVDPAMSGGVSGTGLGLYIVRELVERMDGTIRVDSTRGGGSTFVVELPAA